jgi:hypothetical protein
MRFPEYTGGLALLVLLVGGLIAWDRTHRHTASAQGAESNSVGFMLDVCSLFNDPQEQRSLYFDTTNGTVELSEMLEPPKKGEETVFSSKHVSKTHGTFTMNEVNKTVRVTLGAQAIEYIAFMPGDQCILVHGTLGAANLAKSWYAEADYLHDD